MKERKKLKIRRVKNGTVIDHIRAGYALIVLKIIGIKAGDNDFVSFTINAPSEKYGIKDIAMIEGKELNSGDLNKIALIAPKATVNIIRDSKVIEKYRVKLQKEIVSIVRCTNPNCITNATQPKEPLIPKFHSEKSQITCLYCEQTIDDVVKHIIY